MNIEERKENSCITWMLQFLELPAAPINPALKAKILEKQVIIHQFDLVRLTAPGLPPVRKRSTKAEWTVCKLRSWGEPVTSRAKAIFVAY
ncbi:hypothetical protein ZHAS_00004603 [Anopheles sinensis]|uniref:Uncharacterized protein n=1 Tax=Anopheles sinensis TaxID=74873 RepID=A0A084VHM2_ANOSI|nr:hypothetical protein ZHAS_00004603 [Anopheles sinensis]